MCLVSCIIKVEVVQWMRPPRNVCRTIVTAGADREGFRVLFAKYYESVILYGILAHRVVCLIVEGCLHKRNHIIIKALWDTRLWTLVFVSWPSALRDYSFIMLNISFVYYEIHLKSWRNIIFIYLWGILTNNIKAF